MKSKKIQVVMKQQMYDLLYSKAKDAELSMSSLAGFIIREFFLSKNANKFSMKKFGGNNKGSIK